jgi:hypothetical protein
MHHIGQERASKSLDASELAQKQAFASTVGTRPIEYETK